jgi:hypothetical protein
MSTGLNFTYSAVIPSYGTYGSNLTWPLVGQLQGIGKNGGSWINATRLVLSDVSAQYQGSAGAWLARPLGTLHTTSLTQLLPSLTACSYLV